MGFRLFYGTSIHTLTQDRLEQVSERHTRNGMLEVRLLQTGEFSSFVLMAEDSFTISSGIFEMQDFRLTEMGVYIF